MIFVGCCLAVVLAIVGLTGCSQNTRGEEVRKQTLKVGLDYSDCDPNGGGDMTDGSMGAENTIDETKEIDGVTYKWGKDPIFTYEPYNVNWDAGTTQRKLYDEWKSKGSEEDNGLAKLDGRYVIATGTKYGKPGDKIDFIYKDGSKLKCIIGDQKSPGDSNGSEWGHLYPDGPNINFIEFCATRKLHDNPGTANYFPQFKKDFVGWSTQATDSTSGDTDAQDDRETAGTNRSDPSGYSMEKDGHKFPMALDSGGNPQGEESRGKGQFWKEEHIPLSLKDPSKHDMTHPGADKGTLLDSPGSITNVEDPLSEVYYINMRWEYVSWKMTNEDAGNGEKRILPSGSSDPEYYSWLGKQKVIIKNDKTGKTLIAAAIETGPDVPSRIGGLSPEAMYYLTDGHMNEGDYVNMTVLGWMNDENATPGPTTDNGSQDAKESACSSGNTSDDSIGSGLQGALDFAKMIAEDQNVGYGQDHTDPTRDSIKDYKKGSGQKYRADCSSLVYWSLVKGGGFTKLHDVQGDSAFGTKDGTEESSLKQTGWEEHDINDGDLKAGDVLWKYGHTGFYAGDNTTIEALGNEKGGTLGGEPGDQGRPGHEGESGWGEEIGVIKQSSQEAIKSQFTKYFRYTGSDGGSTDAATTDASSTSSDSSTSGN